MRSSPVNIYIVTLTTKNSMCCSLLETCCCDRPVPMSVLLETSLGEIVIDLLVDDAPIACLNFLKLCKIKYYSQHIFHFIERDLLVQAGDPSRSGKGGSSVFGLLGGAKHFQDEIKKSVKHDKAGTVSMANSGPDSNGSQFFILARDGCDYLDGKAPPAPSHAMPCDVQYLMRCHAMCSI
jgi:cyclophilin family peptidyl-prolyl cis-trans isomerase